MSLYVKSINSKKWKNEQLSINSEYGEWKLVKSQLSQLVSAVTVFKGICSHLKMKVIYK